MIRIGLGFGGGWLGWTLLEYLLHRFVFHEGVLGERATRGHLEHHRTPSHFYPMPDKVAGMGLLVTLVALGAVPLLGPALGAALPAGVAVGWLFYELLHRRVHITAPIGRRGPLARYGRWARRNHLAHHFGHPGLNHGVSTPLWDVVFGTVAPTETVRVPRRHVESFPWLLDPDADEVRLRDDWNTDYRLVG